jgi:hypothetical protein
METKKHKTDDDWGTAKHETFQERPDYRVRNDRQTKRDNGLLAALGGLLIVGGICWAAYLLSSGSGMDSLTKTPGPVEVCAAGVVFSILAKIVR